MSLIEKEVTKKTYESYDNDSELLYLISENTEDAKELIFKKYAPVISYYAKKYASLTEGKGIDYNDLYQEGMIGLDAAIKRYKEQKDIKFSTFAFICIKRKIYSAVKNANRKKHSILNESYSLDYKYDDDSMDFGNVVSFGTESIEDLLVSKENETYFVKRINESLNDFEKKVYILRINGFSYEEIAYNLGKTKKSIDSVLTRIRKKVKKILEEID